jgi:hypothetical protein
MLNASGGERRLTDYPSNGGAECDEMYPHDLVMIDAFTQSKAQEHTGANNQATPVFKTFNNRPKSMGENWIPLGVAQSTDGYDQGIKPLTAPTTTGFATAIAGTTETLNTGPARFGLMNRVMAIRPMTRTDPTTGKEVPLNAVPENFGAAEQLRPTIIPVTFSTDGLGDVQNLFHMWATGQVQEHIASELTFKPLLEMFKLQLKIKNGTVYNQAQIIKAYADIFHLDPAKVGETVRAHDGNGVNNFFHSYLHFFREAIKNRDFFLKERVFAVHVAPSGERNTLIPLYLTKCGGAV